MALTILLAACGEPKLNPTYGFSAQVVAGQAANTVKATKSAGFGWLKQQVRWDGLQPSAGATIDWSQLDTAANALIRPPASK